MPGADAPLFTVPAGQMGVGLGIHGEPGVAEDTLPRAADLAARLVSGVLAEKPADSGDRVTAILNGLGSTKYEELFVVWRTVSKLLADNGLEVVEPEVGELVTSLDMAGCSLTLVFLDDELERLWRDPADTPAYHKGRASPAKTATFRRSTESAAETATRARPSSPASRACGRTIVSGLKAMEFAITQAETELGRIDAVAGDGDHGRGMVKGVGAAVVAARSAADNGAGAQSVLAAAGEGWATKAGGTSGVLWGATLEAIGESLRDDSKATSAATVADAIRAGLQALQRLGKAELGDKTMVDAFVPFVDTLGERIAFGEELSAAWLRATQVSEDAAQATAPLRPRIGRARPLAERSVGTPDAGAISFAMCVRAVAGVLASAH
jgi:dihydroxyacetone kinase